METPKIVNYLKADPTVWNLEYYLHCKPDLELESLLH